MDSLPEVIWFFSLSAFDYSGIWLSKDLIFWLPELLFTAVSFLIIDLITEVIFTEIIFWHLQNSFFELGTTTIWQNSNYITDTTSGTC